MSGLSESDVWAVCVRCPGCQCWMPGLSVLDVQAVRVRCLSRLTLRKSPDWPKCLCAGFKRVTVSTRSLRDVLSWLTCKVWSTWVFLCPLYRCGFVCVEHVGILSKLRSLNEVSECCCACSEGTSLNGNAVAWIGESMFCPAGRRDCNVKWKSRILFNSAPLILYSVSEFQES